MKYVYAVRYSYIRGKVRRDMILGLYTSKARAVERIQEEYYIKQKQAQKELKGILGYCMNEDKTFCEIVGEDEISFRYTIQKIELNPTRQEAWESGVEM